MAPWLVAVWVGVSVGLCKGAMLATQFVLSRWLYHFTFPWSFIASAAGVALVCATVGGYFGTRLGYRLRRVAP